MALAKEKVVCEQGEDLGENALVALVYYALKKSKTVKEMETPGLSHEELFNYCNELYGPQIIFNKTQISRALFNLEDTKKIATKNYTIGGKDVLHYYLI